jgi:hypothetical protein
MCEMLFTSDNLFFEQLSSTEIKKYFEECYNFACERYGRENIISAVVHLDETTPHLHLDFVPLTADGRLSAKEILGVKTDLQKLQDDFYNQVSSKYGLERGNRADLSTGEPTAKHFTTQEYKLKTAKDKLQQAEKELAETKKLVEQSSEALQALQGRVLAQQEVNALKGKKTLTGGLRGISYTDYLSLKKTASYVDKAKSKVKRLETEKDELTEQIKQLHSDLQEAKTARFGYIMQQKNTLVKEIEEKYKKYVFRRVSHSVDIKEITKDICCIVHSDEKSFIVKCPYSEVNLLDRRIKELEQKKQQSVNQIKKCGKLR